MKNQFKTSVSLIALLTLTVACGGSGSGGGSSDKKTSNDQQREEEETEVAESGDYEAFLRPINTRVYGFINSGKAEVKADQNLSVNLVMDDAPGVTHIQSIHIGKRCPHKEDDTNNDGYIDIKEAMTVAGKVLIPLDDNLETQTLGRSQYPTGKSYTFQRRANMKRVMNDLTLPDEDVNDNVIKLTDTEEFSFEGRVIIIQGAYQTALLPSTVATIGTLTSAMSIPIACGRMMKRITAPVP